MAQTNATLVNTIVDPAPLNARRFAKAIEAGAVVVDCRPPELFAQAHIPGALNIGAGAKFPRFAQTLIPKYVDLLVVVEHESQLPDIVIQLLQVGHKEPIAWLACGMQGWQAKQLPMDSLINWTAEQLEVHRRAPQALNILDVRRPHEWLAGHIPGARCIALEKLPQRILDVPNHDPIVVYCSSGYRSTLAASLLCRAGHAQVYNLGGGYSAWYKAHLPVQQ